MSHRYVTTAQHAVDKAEVSHRARGGDPFQLDVSIDVGGVASEGEILIKGQNHSFGCLELDYRRSNGDWEEIGMALERGVCLCASVRVWILYLVSLSGSSYLIWHIVLWAFLHTHNNLHRPFVCFEWWCLAQGLQKTGDQRAEVHQNMFPGACRPDSGRLPGRRWKQHLPHGWECCTPLIFWTGCQDLQRNVITQQRWCISWCVSRNLLISLVLSCLLAMWLSLHKTSLIFSSCDCLLMH